jgi:hypothetical protein
MKNEEMGYDTRFYRRAMTVDDIYSDVATTRLADQMLYSILPSQNMREAECTQPNET